MAGVGLLEAQRLPWQLSHSTVFDSAVHQAVRPASTRLLHAEQLAGKRSRMFLAAMTSCIGLRGVGLKAC